MIIDGCTYRLSLTFFSLLPPTMWSLYFPSLLLYYKSFFFFPILSFPGSYFPQKHLSSTPGQLVEECGGGDDSVPHGSPQRYFLKIMFPDPHQRFLRPTLRKGYYYCYYYCTLLCLFFYLSKSVVHKFFQTAAPLVPTHHRHTNTHLL